MKPPHPPLLFAVCLLAGWAAGKLHPLPLGLGLSPLVLAPCLLLPLGLAGSAILRFRRQRTPIDPHGTPRALVAAGPYRHTRNPMYLGLLMLLLWFSLLLDSLGVLLLVPVLWLLLDRWVIPYEESLLTAHFGDSYISYCQQVRRWL